MRMPFEKLMRLVASYDGDPKVTLGQIARACGEDVHRVMDAIDANRVLSGETTYVELRGPEGPW